MSYCFDGLLFSTNKEDSETCIWKLLSTQELRFFRCCTLWGHIMNGYSADGKIFVEGYHDSAGLITHYIRDLSTGDTLRKFRFNKEYFNYLGFSRDHNY